MHGDDFLAAGEESQFKEQLAEEWKIKDTHIGEAEHLGKYMRVLNRIVRIHPSLGITMEPDPHAEIQIRDLDGESGRFERQCQRISKDQRRKQQNERS